MVYEVFLKAIERHKEYFEKNDIPAIEEYKDEREYNSIIVFSGNLIDVYVWRHNEDSTEVTYSYSSMMNDSDNNKLLLKLGLKLFLYFLLSILNLIEDISIRKTNPSIIIFIL